MATAHTIVAMTHGRYLTESPEARTPAGLLVGFHGYAEHAEAQLDRLRSIPGSKDWFLVSVQGLHRFYNRRSQDVVASWMTRQDRELAIADNLAFVDGVVRAVSSGTSDQRPLVFAGFSQGVAMAFRAACGCRRPVAIIAAGGDVPPELDREALARVVTAFMARGERDEFYSPAKSVDDESRLRGAGVAVSPFVFDGGHEWTPEVAAAAGAFLNGLTASKR